MKHYYLLFLFVLIPLLCVAQRVDAYNWEGAFFVGAVHYSGDLNPMMVPSLENLRPSVGISGRVPIGLKTAVRSGFAFARLAGSESDYPQSAPTGYSFQADIFETNILLEFEPFAKDKFFSDSKGNLNLDKLLSPYIFAGGALSFVRVAPDFSKVQDSNSDPMIQADLRESTERIVPVIPVGAGIKLDLNIDIGIALEVSSRFAFSDYMDGISKSGNVVGNDSYLMINFCLFRRF